MCPPPKPPPSSPHIAQTLPPHSVTCYLRCCNSNVGLSDIETDGNMEAFNEQMGEMVCGDVGCGTTRTIGNHETGNLMLQLTSHASPISTVSHYVSLATSCLTWSNYLIFGIGHPPPPPSPFLPSLPLLSLRCTHNLYACSHHCTHAYTLWIPLLQTSTLAYGVDVLFRRGRRFVFVVTASD
jgi:hypothetical protein